MHANQIGQVVNRKTHAQTFGKSFELLSPTRGSGQDTSRVARLNFDSAKGNGRDHGGGYEQHRGQNNGELCGDATRLGLKM